MKIETQLEQLFEIIVQEVNANHEFAKKIRGISMQMRKSHIKIVEGGAAEELENFLQQTQLNMRILLFQALLLKGKHVDEMLRFSTQKRF